jgi:hypothetical protein
VYCHRQPRSLSSDSNKGTCKEVPSEKLMSIASSPPQPPFYIELIESELYNTVSLDFFSTLMRITIDDSHRLHVQYHSSNTFRSCLFRFSLRDSFPCIEQRKQIILKPRTKVPADCVFVREVSFLCLHSLCSVQLCSLLTLASEFSISKSRYWS